MNSTRFTLSAHDLIRFWNFIDADRAYGCWNWNGTTADSGEAQFRHGRRSELAHRVMYRLTGADLTRGEAVVRTCGNNLCVRPDHLEAKRSGECLRGVKRTTFVPQGKKGRPVEDRFWERVEKSEQCWNWIGSINAGGYGVFTESPTKHWVAHRYSWTTANGLIPEESVICHRCDNRKCVRIEHLFLGTMSDNTRDMVAKGRQSERKKDSRSKRPGNFPERNRASLNPGDIPVILDRVARGERVKLIATDYGVQANVLYHVVAGRTWSSCATEDQRQAARQGLGR